MENYETLEHFRLNISGDSLDYPQMKILDMCFWQIGYDLDNQKNDNTKGELNDAL